MDYQINKSKEIDFKPSNNRLEEVLFNVAEYPVFAKSGKANNLYSMEYPAKNFKALVNLNRNQVLSIVSQNYHTIDNRQALEMGKHIFCEIFPIVSEKDLIPFKIIASQSLTSCHIDLIHKEVKLDKWHQDTWLPFVRISNSFNRTLALSFELGFVRSLCSNGFIFKKEFITVKYSHIKGMIPSITDIDTSGLKKFEIDFVGYLNNLYKHNVNRKYVFPLVLKAVNLNFKLDHENPKIAEKERIRFLKTKGIIAFLTDQYYKELNSNAYAVFNVLTDFISHQSDYKILPFYTAQVNSYYQKPGIWISDFVKSTNRKDFSMDKYLIDYLKYQN